MFVDIPVEDILQFVGHLPVKDECIHFEVIAKRTCIQIGCSYGAEESVQIPDRGIAQGRQGRRVPQAVRQLFLRPASEGTPHPA